MPRLRALDRRISTATWLLVTVADAALALSVFFFGYQVLALALGWPVL